jgi:signal transduction histidine kinase
MREILTDIVVSDGRANDVVTALRAMLRRQHTTRTTFDAADAVREVLALVRSEVVSAQIEMRTALEPACFLTADKTQVTQVLLNLIMNAVDAMRGMPETGRSLSITLSGQRENEVKVSIRDSGRGIPANKLPRVFDAFWSTKQKGLGMGLPLCRAIVESYSGRIWCEKNDVGGVTFHFILPAAHQKAAQTSKQLSSDYATGRAA